MRWTFQKSTGQKTVCRCCCCCCHSCLLAHRLVPGTQANTDWSGWMQSCGIPEDGRFILGRPNKMRSDRQACERKIQNLCFQDQIGTDSWCWFKATEVTSALDLLRLGLRLARYSTFPFDCGTPGWKKGGLRNEKNVRRTFFRTIFEPGSKVNRSFPLGARLG